MARVLGVVRLSRDREESTSPERQKAAIERWAQDRGHEVIGWAEDLDVSGAVAPWKRKSLGEWLPETIGREVSKAEEQAALARSRAGEWDILCAWKLDRISRRLLHTWQLHEWCKQHGKTLATANDGVDLTTPMGEMFFMLLAMFAHSELETIKFRAKDSFDHLMKVGRWRGGFVPYGYRPERSWRADRSRTGPAVHRAPAKLQVHLRAAARDGDPQVHYVGARGGGAARR